MWKPKWKPGQLVTLDHHVYRVTRNKGPMIHTCSECYRRNGRYACNRARTIGSRPHLSCVQNAPINCYLKFVK